MSGWGHLAENLKSRAQLSSVFSDLLCAGLASLLLAIWLLADQGILVCIWEEIGH